MKILRDIKLANYTTFGIGGKADYFVAAKTKKQILEAVKWAKKKGVDYFILGHGSNVLVADKGVRGLVIKTESLKLKAESSRIIAQAGVSLSNLIQYSLKHSLSGLEVLAGIPGTVGGSVVGNAGTEKGSIAQVVEKVTVLGEDAKIKDLDRQKCQFDYRRSCFQKNKEIILEVTFNLKKEKPVVIKKRIAEVLKTRKNQPKGKNAGSIFKNPRFASAGYLIENAGFKGKKVGRAMISYKHANWIINLDIAKALDVLKLISLIKDKVWKDFKVKLEEEIVFLGDF